MNSYASAHANRVDKMSGIGKKRIRQFSSAGKRVVKKLMNAKRRRFLKINQN